MKNLSVADGLFVEIEYVLTEESPDGEVLEECPAEQAFGFKMGAGEVLPAFEKALLGKKTGNRLALLFHVLKHMEKLRQRLSTHYQRASSRLTENLMQRQFNQERFCP